MTDRPGALIIIGGGEDKTGDREILKAVAERARGGRLVIATVASHEPDGYFEAYKEAFEPLGISDLVERAPPASSSREETSCASPVRSATRRSNTPSRTCTQTAGWWRGPLPGRPP